MAGSSRMRLVTAIVLALGMLVPVFATAAAAPAQGGATRERVIVVLHSDGSDPESVASELGQRHNGQVGFVYHYALRGFSMELPARAIAAIARDSRVAFVEKDQIARTFVDVPTGVDRIEADKNATAGIGSVTAVSVDIAIIDTGVASHPDLNIYRTIDCTKGNPLRGKCEGTSSDGNGHGTHVAGTAAATNSGSIVGVAPGARIWGVKVLGNDGSGRISSIVAGIDYVTANAGEIEVANMSLGCECSSAAMDTALTNSTAAGVVYIAAAGNSAKDAATFSPANHPRVIAVSAMSDGDGQPGGLLDPTCRNAIDDTFADFSNFGTVVDIAAPGVCITSTWLNGGFNTISGTSMASPHVAGAAALYIVENNIGKSSTRWSTVKNGLLSNWTVPQDDPCGFTGGKSDEPLLMVAVCGTTDVDRLPSVVITSPADGATVSGVITLSADASDDIGVTQVEFFAGTTSVGVDSDGSDGWSTEWNSESVADGNKTITARATDTAGQTAEHSVTVMVDNVDEAPVVNIINPLDNSVVSGSVAIKVSATDAEDATGDLNVDVSVDGVWHVAPYNSDSGYYEYIWDTTSLENGSAHSIAARATDSGGNVVATSPVSVTVDNSAPTTMHVASLAGTSLSSGSTWTAQVTVTIHDASNNPVQTATVSGNWSNGASGSVSCITGSNGQCTVSVGGIPKRTSSVTFTVSNVSGTLTYDSSENSVTSITVLKP
jgi:subtilisin family serine protease